MECTSPVRFSRRWTSATSLETEAVAVPICESVSALLVLWLSLRELKEEQVGTYGHQAEIRHAVIWSVEVRHTIYLFFGGRKFRDTQKFKGKKCTVLLRLK